MNPKKYSWQTTSAGIATFLAALAAALKAASDNDPGTVPDWTLVVVSVGPLLLGIFARDNDKRSEDVGAMRAKDCPQGGPAPINTRLLPVLLIFVALGASGCILNRRDRGDIVGITQSVVGIDLSQSPADTVPHLRLGYIRTQIHVVPTGKGTNGVIHAPPVANSMHTEISLSRTDIIEDFNTGSAAEDDAFRGDSTAARTVAAGRSKTNAVSNPK